METGTKVIMRTNVGTGEKYAGYYDPTGEFKMVMKIQTDHDLDLFIDQYDISYMRIERVS